MTYGQNKKDIWKFAEAIGGVSKEDIRSGSRKQHIVRQRKLICWLLRNKLGLSYPSIADEVGMSDHTSAMHHVRTFDVENLEKTFRSRLMGPDSPLSSNK